MEPIVYFCIRDDDTSFFTSPDELEQEFEMRLSSTQLQNDEQYLSEEAITEQLLAGEFSLDKVVGDIESRCIRIALELYDNNVSKASNALNVNRTTLYSRVNKLSK